MNKDEIIARQAAKIFDLEDKLAEANEMKNSFFNQLLEEREKSIPITHISDNEAMGALAHARVTI